MSRFRSLKSRRPTWAEDLWRMGWVATTTLSMFAGTVGCRPDESTEAPTTKAADSAVTQAALREDWHALLEKVRRERGVRIESVLRLGDGEVGQLVGMRDLTSVVLPGAAVSDRATEALATLESLEELVLGDTTITDRGLENLAALNALRDLNLNTSRVTDQGLRQLAALPRLELLRLGSSEITDDGMAAIAKIGSLRFLLLQNARITGRGFKHLHGLKRLESLYLRGNPLTGEGVDGLREALPHLHPDW